jgi:hypothetical protein
VSVRRDLCMHLTYSLSYFLQGASREYTISHDRPGQAEGQSCSSSRRPIPKAEARAGVLPRIGRPGFWRWHVAKSLQELY